MVSGKGLMVSCKLFSSYFFLSLMLLFTSFIFLFFLFFFIRGFISKLEEVECSPICYISVAEHCSPMVRIWVCLKTHKIIKEGA